MGRGKRESRVEFPITTVFSRYNKNTNKTKLLIITHRDLDGVCSAVILQSQLQEQFDQIDVIMTQPYLMQAFTKDLFQRKTLRNYNKVALLDISIDSYNFRNTKSLIELLGNKLLYLFDHHIGWGDMYKKIGISNAYITHNERLLELGNQRHVVVNDQEVSCAKVIYDYFNLEDEYLTDVVRIGIIADDLSLRIGTYDSDIHEIFKGLKNMPLSSILGELCSKKSVRDISLPKDERTEINRKAAEDLVAVAVEISPGMCYIRCDDLTKVDYTAVCEIAYSKYDVVIIREMDARSMRFHYVIAHNREGLDLTKVFRLKSGSPRRVTIFNRIPVEEIVNRITRYV